MGFSQMMPVSDPVTGALFSGLQVPPANFIMVNTKGKRFVDEYGSRDKLSQAAIDNGGLFYPLLMIILRLLPTMPVRKKSMFKLQPVPSSEQIL